MAAMGDCLNRGGIQTSRYLKDNKMKVSLCGRKELQIWEKTRIHCVLLDWRYYCEHVVFQYILLDN